MKFDGGMIEPVVGWLVDPEAKVRIGSAAPRESFEFNTAKVFVDYDPELSEQNLTQPPSPEIKAVYLATPGAEHLAEEPEVYRSHRSVRLETLDIQWEYSHGVLDIWVANDLKRLQTKVQAIRAANVPGISDRAAAFLLYVLQSIPLFTGLRGNPLEEKFPDLKSVRISLDRDAGLRLFGLEISDPELDSARKLVLAVRTL